MSKTAKTAETPEKPTKRGRPKSLPAGTSTRSWRVTPEEADAISAFLRGLRARAKPAKS